MRSVLGEDFIPPEVVVEKVEVDGHTVKRRYRRGRFLGKGGFAQCYEMRRFDSDKILAGKIVQKSKLVRQSAKLKLLSEIEIHKSVDHKRIVKFHNWFEDPHNVYIILEFCENQTLSELLKRRSHLTEREVQYYMLQLLSAMEYLHNNWIIHRDLKLGNIFLDSELGVKVGDFGLATKLKSWDERKRTLCGTPNYIAPEILASRKDGHSFEVDIWSMGIIMYTLLIGKPPFETSNIKRTYQKIQSIEYSFPITSNVSHNAKKLIRQILHVDPTRRPSLKQFQNDIFFTNSRVPRSLPIEARYVAPHSRLRRADDTQKLSDQFKSLDLAGKHAKKTPLQEATNSAKRQAPFGHQSHKPVRRKHNPFTERKEQRSHQPRRQNAFNALTGKENVVEASKGSANNRLLKKRTNRNLISPPMDKNEKLQKPYATVSSKSDRHPIFGLTGRESNSPQRPRKRQNLQASPTKPRLQLQDNDRSELSDRTILNLRSIHKEMEDSANSPQTRDWRRETIDTGPPVWCVRWVDYTNKYGMGYRLSDGSHGTFFNDLSKLVLAANNRNFEYLARGSNQRKGYTTNQYPKELKKKVALLEGFFRVLKSQTSSGPNTYERSTTTKDLVYIQAFQQGGSASMFEFSNGSVQVNFNDNSEIIVYPTEYYGKLVTYTDSGGERKTYTIRTAFHHERRDLRKRMDYVRQYTENLLKRQERSRKSIS